MASNGKFSSRSVATLDMKADTVCLGSLFLTSKCAPIGTHIQMIVSGFTRDNILPYNFEMLNYYTSAIRPWSSAWFSRLIQYIIDPAINLYYLPIVVMFMLIHSRIIREVLDEGSTMFFHKIEIYQDLFMIVQPWLALLFIDRTVAYCWIGSIFKENSSMASMISTLFSIPPFWIVY